MESNTSHEAEGHGGMDVNGLCSPGGIWLCCEGCWSSIKDEDGSSHIPWGTGVYNEGR